MCKRLYAGKLMDDEQTETDSEREIAIAKPEQHYT